MEKRTSFTSRILGREVMMNDRFHQYADGSTIGILIKYPTQSSSKGGGKKSNKGKGR